MPTLTPVEFDPFTLAGQTGGAALTPADRALFAQSAPRAPGLFDDLIPTRPGGDAQQSGAPIAPAAPGLFDDLIPPKSTKAPTLTPVDHDPWAQYVTPAAPQPTPGVRFAQPAPAAPAQQADPWAQYVQPAPAQQAAPEADDDPYTREPATWSDTKGALGKAVDLNAAAANGVTVGFAPKLGALVDSDPIGKLLGTAGPNTPTYEQALKGNQANMDRVYRENPVGAKVAGGAGALLSALAGGSVVGAGARGLAGVPVLGRVAGNSLAQGAATGAGLGGADAAAHDQPVGTGAALGAIGGVGGAALGSAVSRAAGSIGDMFAGRPPIMTSPQLQGAARQAYSDAENAGVVYSPAAMDRLNNAVRDHMADFGYAQELQPGGAAVLRSLDRSHGTPTTLKGLDITRRIAGSMYSPLNPSQSRLGSGIKGVIDDFTANPRPGDVIMGDQAAGTEALGRARDLYNRASKDQDLSDALEHARLVASGTGSGGNINNATRQQVRQVYEGRKDWTPDEQAALTRLITGTPASNTLRQVGKMSPEGNGLVPLLELGGMHLDPHTVALPIVGAVAKRMADASTARAAANVGALIRAGGDASAMRLPPNALQAFGARAGRPISTLSLGDYLAPSDR